VIGLISRYVAHPLMEWRDPHSRMAAYRALQDTERLSRPQLRERQLERLRTILRYAETRCDWYRRQFAAVGFSSSTRELESDFSRVPLLTKQDVREHADEIIATGYSRSTLVEARTGGSTGTSLQVFFDEACQAQRNAAAMRSDSWAGWRPGLPVGALWGNPPEFTTWRSWARNTFYDRLDFLDTMNMTPATMTAFFERSQRRRDMMLYGHAHSIYLYAAFLADQRLVPRPPAGIVTTSMMLLAPERKVIEHVFGTRVSDRYGCEEVGLIAAECEERQGLHVNIDHLYLEVLDEGGSPAAPGTEGRIVVTDLLNLGMPLVRYELGDLGTPTDRQCSCGRGLPLLERVTGRVADFLIRSDGSKVAGISMIERTLTKVAGIRQLQIVQDDINRFEINLVETREYGPHSERELREEFAHTFGPAAKVQINLVQAIGRLPSGKFSFSICRVPVPPEVHR
jgi:phenylacetate-CoA ligase